MAKNFQDKALIYAAVAASVVIIPYLLVQFFQGFRRNDSQFRDDIWDAMPAPERERKIDEYIVRENLAKLSAQDRLELPAPEAPPSQKASAKTTKHSSDAPSRFRPPNFNGPPHAVLGLPPNPNKDDIQAAYRHWIKRYHPDHVAHLGARFTEQAIRRASQLNEAKAALLQGLKG